MPDAADPRLAVACALAREAGALARRRFLARPAGLVLDLKGHQDYFSALDGEVEALLREGFARHFPGDLFFGEEAGGRLDGDAWVVDPIDGTSNFVRGNPHFGIAIAFVRDGAVAVGVIYDPMRDQLYAAARGSGATLDGVPLAVSGLADPAVATVETGWSNRSPRERYLALVDGLLRAGASVRRSGSAALALAGVAAGRLDAYCDLHIHAWDVLAGILLVEEAGGTVTDFLAGSGLTAGNPILACTPGLRDALSRATGIA